MGLRGPVVSSRDGVAGTASVVTGTFPVGTVAGDRISITTNINNTTATVVASTNAGANVWTVTHGPDDPVAATERVYLFERVLDAVDVSTGFVTFTWSGTGTPGRVQCEGDVWTAGDAITPFGTVQFSTSAVNTATAPAYTTVSPFANVYMLIGARVAAGNLTPVVVVPGTYTKDAAAITTVATNANCEAVAAHLTTTVAAGTSVGGGSLSSSAKATHWVIYVNELRETVSVTSSRATTWATLARVTPSTRATTWLTAAAITASRATSWLTATTVAATRATTWGALASAAVSRATTWATRAQVTSQRSSTWNVDALAVVTTTRATTWTTAAPVTATRATTWAARQTIATTAATTWTVCTPVATSRATTWASLEAATATRATTWGARSLVAAQRATAWDVKVTVVTTRATTWHVAILPRPTPPERITSFTFPDRSSSWTLPERTSSLTLPSRTTSTTLGA